MSNILGSRRAAALLSAAIVVGAVSLPFAIGAFAGPVEVISPLSPSNSFASVVEADKPAVVTITTTLGDSDTGDDSGNGGLDQQFQQFFHDRGMAVPGRGAPHRSGGGQALGSGFIIGAEGIIVTNNHVVQNASDIKVTLDDGTELPAKLLGADAKSDLAVLKVSASRKLPTVSWGDSDKLKLGDQILAIGNPFGIGTTVTAGIVSARGRDLHDGPYDNFIQIDAPINHGNSGGPLVDSSGGVVGINTAIYSPNGGSVGVGFAIPSDEAKQIIARLQKSGSIDHGYLGIAIQPVTRDVANALGLSNVDGALIASVNAGSPAAEAGLRPGDIVTVVAGEVVKTPRDLSRFVADLSPATTQKMTIVRGGQPMDINVTIGGDGRGKA